MATLTNAFFGVMSWMGSALGVRRGRQLSTAMVAPIADVPNYGADGAMQLSAVWACLDRRAGTVGSLPFFAYESRNGLRELARTSRLYTLLHESPNARMTPMEFWRTMVMFLDLRGRAFAQLDRDERTGEVISMWPLDPDQVEVHVLPDDSIVYLRRIDNDVLALAESSILPLKGLGNGTTGLDKLHYMRPTTGEAVAAQGNAVRMFSNSGKPTGVLMVDAAMNKEQRARLAESFADMAVGPVNRLRVLEANMKYQQLSLSPEDQQLLQTRQFSIEEICRWLDVPPVLIYHSNVTTWGSGVAEIIDGFHKFSIRPILVSIEQAVRKHVMTPGQRARMTAEFNFDALLRGSIKDRFEVYAKGTQNGVMTRNEARQLENLPPDPDGNQLTAQSNLIPLGMLGKIKSTGGSSHADPQVPAAQ